MPSDRLRVRREPPPFRRAQIASSEPVTPWLQRLTLEGPELSAIRVTEPASSVRLLLPEPGVGVPTIPQWNGNEFLTPDGSRPRLRTLTPIPLGGSRLAVEVVLHDGGVASNWAQTAGPGDSVAVSGPGRGSAIDSDAPDYVVAGDETALPAIRQVLDALAPETPAQVFVELAQPDARVALGRRTVQWLTRERADRPGSALVSAVRGATIAAGTRVWAAGEAAAMQSVRRHLLEERDLARAHTIVRGYWKFGRRGDADSD